jgi:hypothetical protein
MKIIIEYYVIGTNMQLSHTISTASMGPTQPPNQWIPAALTPGIKRPGRESDHSPQPSEKLVELPPLPSKSSLCDA